MIVSENTIVAEGLGTLFKNLGRSSARESKKSATFVLKIPGRAVIIRAKLGSAAVGKIQKDPRVQSQKL